MGMKAAISIIFIICFSVPKYHLCSNESLKKIPILVCTDAQIVPQLMIDRKAISKALSPVCNPDCRGLGKHPECTLQ